MNSFDENSIITLHETTEDRSQDFCPKTFDDYLGQKELKDKLAIYTQAAKMRGEPLDHLLLFGPPGVGKTTLAQIMAHVMNVGIKIISGPMLERTGDLVAILSSLDNRDILFIDEIHRMSAHVEEVLYSAMEHFRVDVIIGQGAGAKSINLPINPFTLVGATTKSGMISAPLRTRFGIVERIDFYNDEDLSHIVLQNAQFLSMQLDHECATMVGKCARGTPRIAKKLLRRIRDFAQVTNKNIIDQQLISQALKFLGIDSEGLTALDNLMLQRIIEHFNGGPVGLETLAALLGEDKETIEEVYEPFLLRKGYIEKTARGRQIPAKKLPFLKQKFLGQNSLV
ncbi:Holliday junction ATP-dependent DNA helicase RuvB [Candidatus Dependentiae bacterium Noda2021]|nr:Holliday junction ATP-dependent DNA helicase RuvB [Candidatus Dependentiae bacterium Noda2021]